MAIIIGLLPFLLPALPCVLAVYWKRRNGLHWYLSVMILTLPVSSIYMSYYHEEINASPMGGTKLGILLISEVISTILVSCVISLLPKKEKSRDEPDIQFRL